MSREGVAVGVGLRVGEAVEDLFVAFHDSLGDLYEALVPAHSLDRRGDMVVSFVARTRLLLLGHHARMSSGLVTLRSATS